MTTATRVELRCKGKIHGVKKEYPDGKVFLEVRCKDHWCTEREPGTVVFHYFDWFTGELSHTKKFRDPIKQSEREARNLNGNNGKVKNQ